MTTKYRWKVSSNHKKNSNHNNSYDDNMATKFKWQQKFKWQLVWILKNEGNKNFLNKTNCNYSIVKDSSADLGANSKIVQIRPKVKAVSTKISK